jgi:hypothetical protein
MAEAEAKRTGAALAVNLRKHQEWENRHINPREKAAYDALLRQHRVEDAEKARLAAVQKAKKRVQLTHF